MDYECIILKKVKYLQKKQKFMDYLIKITTNFTGAALDRIASSLLTSLQLKKDEGKQQELSIQQITDATILTSKQFAITLGAYTLPQIYQLQTDTKLVFTDSFLSKIARNLLIVKHNQQNKYQISYANEVKKYEQTEEKIVSFFEKYQEMLELPDSFSRLNGGGYQNFKCFLKTLFPRNRYAFEDIRSNHVSFNEYCGNLQDYIQQRNPKNNLKRILFVESHPQSNRYLYNHLNPMIKNSNDFYMIYYLSKNQNLEYFQDTFFGSQQDKAHLKMTQQFQSQKNVAEKEKDNYTGRIMVELSDQVRMAFELKNKLKGESNVAFKFFLKTSDGFSAKAVIPELVQFFTKKKVSYILLIDYEMFLQNDAFEQKKIFQVLQEKMMEAKNYDRVAVMVNLDSLIILNENASDSNFGRSMSYSIQNHSLYQIIYHYMVQFAAVSGKISRWMTIISRNPELITKVKRDLIWPKYPEDLEKEKEDEKLNVDKRCVRCGAFYKQKDNKEQRKCMQHLGRIINTELLIFEDDNVSIEALKAEKIKLQKQQSKKIDNLYIYSCCLKGIEEQGEYACYHVQNQNEDELKQLRLQKSRDWDNVLNLFE